MFDELLGEKPPFNDKAIWLKDPFENKVYMMGGLRPGEKNSFPCSDLYFLETSTMSWTNLSDSLTFRKPSSPMSAEECKREKRGLPKLSLPASTLLRVHDMSFLLIFGGYDADEDITSSQMIVVNLSYREWWFADIQGGPVWGRIDPTMVAIDEKVYIFGGYRNFEGDGSPHQSFSIAALSQDGSWHWELKDTPYTFNVQPGTIFSQATPIYHGSKILLTPGRTTSQYRGNLSFSNANIFCFHIARRKFQAVDFTGDFPQNVQWYQMFALDSFCNPTAAVSIKRRGKRRTNPVPLPGQLTPPSTSSSSSSSVSSVLICAWVNSKPRVWRLELTPSECFSVVEMNPDILNQSERTLEAAMVVGKQLFLFGSSTRYNTDIPLSNDKYDTYVDIPLTW